MAAEGKKGGAYEKYLLDTFLKRVWPDAYRPRLMGVYDYGDFAKVDGWLIEAKKRERWQLPLWIREARAKIARAGRNPDQFIIMFAMDKRSGIPDMSALPTEQLIQLFEELEGYKCLYEMTAEMLGKVSPNLGEGKETE